MTGLLSLRAFSGQKERMGDCSHSSSAIETGMLEPIINMSFRCEAAAGYSPESGPQSSQSSSH